MITSLPKAVCITPYSSSIKLQTSFLVPCPPGSSNYRDFAHLCHLPTGVPRVHVQHAASETTELVLAVQNLDGVPSADALSLQVIQPAGSDEVATAVGIATAGPGFTDFGSRHK